MGDKSPIRNCNDCIHVDVCQYKTDPERKNCIDKHSKTDIRLLVRARWIITYSGAYCSRCATKSTSGISSEFLNSWLPDWCPHCGAYMKIGGKNNDWP